MWHPELSPVVAAILDRYEGERERRAQAEWNQCEAARRREQQLRQLDRRAPVRQAGDRLVTTTTKGESVSLSVEELRQYRPDVPPPPPLAAKAGVTRRKAETLRAWVWQQPFNRCDRDWVASRRSYPADPQGTCRHKASYLRDHLGGRVLFGARTDRRGACPHAVLEIMVGGERLILDEDRAWKASEAPFAPYPIPWLPGDLQPGQQRTAPPPPPRSDAALRALQDQLVELERRVGDGLRYREVWQEGVQYQAGDAVTRSGHLWVALAPTCEQPGAGASAWRLAVKGGRDGRDAPGHVAQKRMVKVA